MTSTTRMRLYLVCLVLTLVAMGFIARCSRSSTQSESIIVERDYPQIAQEGKLRVLASYAQHQEANSSGSIVMLSRRLSQASGLEIEIRLEDNTDEALRLLASGQIDLIMHPLVRSSAIDTIQYRWVRESTSGPIYLVQRLDSATRLTRQLDLEGQTIHLPKGSPHALFVQHLANEIGGTINITEDELYNTEQLIVLVQARQIDLTLCNEDERKRLETHFPELDFSLPLSHSLRRGWLVRRSSPMLSDSLSSWLN